MSDLESLEPESARGSNTRIRVCHINTRHLRGGGAKATSHLLCGLDKSCFDVHFVVGDEVDWDQLDALAGEGVKVTVIDDLVRPIRTVQDWRALVQLCRFIQSQRFDIVHTHYAKGGVLGRWAAYVEKVPIIVHSLHGSTFHRFYSPVSRRVNVALERCLGRLTSHYVSVSQALKNSYLGQGISEPERYSVIRSGMDLDAFREAGNLSTSALGAKRGELGLKADDLVVGHVARFVDGKGHECFIDAARLIARQHPKAKFLLVGDGPEEPRLRQLVKGCGLDEVLTFTGYREDAAEIIACLDVMMCTSLWEGLSQVWVQAAAVGRPIVAFDVGSTGEVVRDGLNGFVVPLGDTVQLAEKTAYLLSDLDHARKMGMKGKDIIGDSWSVETMVQQTEDLYQRLLRERGMG
jgi:glycosyltransferase involved in cell wall biosynthesis